MFVPPRFIVVDDQKEHLESIQKTFTALNAPCTAIHYDPANDDPDPRLFSGVRVLFMDLHLNGGMPSSDDKQHFSTILSFIERLIDPGGGPYILVVWTQKPEEVEELAVFIQERLPDEHVHRKPLDVISLPKEDFIKLSDGTRTNPDDLRARVKEIILSTPQLAALVQWETDVMHAAGDTLQALMNLVPENKRNIGEYGSNLNRILSLLAVRAVGRPNVTTNPRAAVNAVLTPILADRVANQKTNTDMNELWQNALTRHDERDLDLPDDESRGLWNRMLHVSSLEEHRATDWGAIVEFPDELWNDDTLRELFGVDKKFLLGGEFMIERDSRSQCRPRLVRVGAACDYAQGRQGPITFLLAFEMPLDVERKTDRHGHPLPLPAAVWRSPVLSLEHVSAFCLEVHSRYPLTKAPDSIADWHAKYRLREQLLMQLINHASNYISRPGTIAF